MMGRGNLMHAHVHAWDMPHVIEVFTAGCSLCQTVLAMAESGKCSSCVMEEHNLGRADEAQRELVERYGIRAVPTVVIDGKIRVEGVPGFPWVCGDDFYSRLEREFPLSRDGGDP
jgi:glutaredoxin